MKRSGIILVPKALPASPFEPVERPGTGKTTVARVLGRMLYALGIISSGHCVERAAGDLIGSFVGQTKDKVSRRGL